MTEHILTRATPLTASTWNAESWTFDVVLSAGAPVPRVDARGAYDELLSLSESAWPSVIPLLDSHDRGSVDSKLGQVDNLRMIGGELHGRATLSRHNPKSQRIAAELTDGQTFAVSIGYIVKQQRERQNPETKRREKIAIFDLVEASLVIIPADRHAGIRSMTTETTPAAAPENTQTAVADRSAVNNEIRSIARVANLGQDFIDAQIDAGATVETARAAAFEAMRARTAPATQIRTASVGVDYSDPEFRARAIGEALFTRVAPSHKPSEESRAYIGLSVPEIARDCLRTRGIQTTGLSSARVIERALQSTSDFPLILADTTGRTLRQAYESAPAGVRRLARQTTANDFRTKHRLQFSASPALEKVNEHGEFKSGGTAEAKESYALETFGKIVGFTRQAMVNDDLGAFADITRRLGQAAAAFENNFLANLVIANPKMSDNKAMFHVDHGNLAAAGAVIDVDSLSAGRLAMRQQKGLQNELIAVTPKFLLVGADRETQAEKVVNAITPNTTGEVNPFASRLEVVVDPRIAGAWYLVADPAQIDGLEYSYLEGEAGPQVTSEVGFDIDGVRFRVRLDFGAGFVDWRGWFRNPGA